MTTTMADVRGLDPLDRSTAIELGRTEYQRLVDVLRDLSEHDWERPTDCTEWTVRDLAGHVAGMMSSNTSFRRFVGEQIRATRLAKRKGIEPVDAMTTLQVEHMAPLTAPELVERMQRLVDPAAAGRRRLPAWFGRSAKFPQVVNGTTERWSLDYLFGIIVTRDTWLHRVADVARAVDRAPVLSADHDGRIVADVVVEWTRRHGRDVELTLTGPAGGHFRQGTSGPQLEVDAVEFCRMLSGRAEPTHELLTTNVPF
jgi:uncharacterized protein (TIGR03083 family)